jgi:hypothetical protein
MIAIETLSFIAIGRDGKLALNQQGPELLIPFFNSHKNLQSNITFV